MLNNTLQQSLHLVECITQAPTTSLFEQTFLTLLKHDLTFLIRHPNSPCFVCLQAYLVYLPLYIQQAEEQHIPLPYHRELYELLVKISQ